MKKEMNNKGFSLVELIIVIAIMAVLVGVMAPQYLKYVKQSKISTDITNAEEIATAFSVAIADATISLPSGTSTTSYSSVPSGLSITAWPGCKLNPSISDWNVTLDANGVSKITLSGTAEIWPNPESATGYKTQNQ